MADYNVGNIEIGIKSTSINSIKDIDQVIAKLQEFKKIDKDVQNVFNSINKLSNGFAKLSTLNITPLSNKISELSKLTDQFATTLSSLKQVNIAETANAFNKIINAIIKIDRINTMDFSQLSGSFNSLTTAISPFLDKLNASEKALIALSTVLSKLNSSKISKATKEMTELEGKTNKTKNSLGSMFNGINLKNLFNVGKITYIYNISKRYLQAFSRMVKSSIDFNETLNKFQTSFGSMSKQARQFAEEMATAFNLSTDSILNYMATFNNMLTALGDLDISQTTKLSETLTRMAVDYASLFNVEINKAMEQFQGVLSGQIRSIRTTSGYDVSETSIFGIYQELGGTKSMRQLSQLEKRLLRILAIQKQMSATGAVEDFAKTLNEPANVLKQISETFKEIGRWIAALITETDKFQKILINMLAVFISVREVFKSLAISWGYVEKQFEQGTGFEGLTSDINSASEAYDELSGKLLSFDKFEALNSSKNNGVSSDLQMIIDSLAEYKTSLSSVSNVANDISKKMMEWLGYTYNLETQTWELKKGYENIEKIRDAIVGVIGAIAGSQILSWLSKIISALFGETGIITMVKGNPQGMKVGGWIGLIITAFAILYTKHEEFKKSFNNFLNTAGESIKTIFSAVGTIIEKIYPVLVPLIERIIVLIGDFLAPIIDKITESIEIVTDDLMDNLPFIEDVIFTVLGLINSILNLLEPILKIVGWIVDKVMMFVNLFTKFINSFLSGAGKTIWFFLKGILNLIMAILDTLGALLSFDLNKIRGIGDIWSNLKFFDTGPQQFANGGFATKGQVFIANEAGPELVGNIGGKNAIANNDMIVTAIENASYRGIVKGLNAGQNGLNDRITFDFSNTRDSALARLLAIPLVEELKSRGYKIEKYT